MRMLSINTDSYLVDEPTRRNITVQTLKKKLLDTIVNDRLIAAILDDEKKAA